MTEISKTVTQKTDSNTVKDSEEFLTASILSGFVFNTNLIMQQMVANQHALQQLLTASTARAVADISNATNPDENTTIKNIEIVLKAIEGASTSSINLIRELSTEATNAIKTIKQ